MSYYFAFAKTGAPEVEGLPRWPSYTDERPVWMVVDRQSKVTVGAMNEKMQVLSTLDFPAVHNSK